MKQTFYKFFYPIICSILLIGIYIYGFTTTELPQIVSSIPISLTIHSQENKIEISIYQADDTHFYAFLPSYAQMDKVKINTYTDNDIFIDNIKLKKGITCRDFEIGQEYNFKFNNRNDLTIQFYQSSNVATLFINTATGSMERVHHNKDYELSSSLCLMTSAGYINHVDNDCSLRGRGNSTWNPEKKPYALSLSAPDSLLGMTDSTDWVLLANSFDQTNLRNKLVLDLARQTDLSWTPDCEYVDLYLNGTYNGLYLLTEKIDVSPTHLNIDLNNGDFLCKYDFWAREDSLRNPFVTVPSPRMVEITQPQKLTEKEKTRIHTLVNELEADILACASSDTLPNIDLDSWVCRYLIDEISANGDSDLASSYFYYTDNTFFAGPIWDYDGTFGSSIRNENPEAFTAKNYHKGTHYTSPYYSSLYENELFYSKMTEMYQLVFLPRLNQLLNYEIQEMSDKITSATNMNSLRWESMFSQSTDSVTTTEELIHYLNKRVGFLNRAWIEGTDYCTVQVETGSKHYFYNISVIRGEYLDSSYLDPQVSTWYNAKTGEIFDISLPIKEDISLVIQHE